MKGKKFIQNNLIYLSSIVIGGTVGYLFNFMLARNLTVSQYGEFQSIVSIMMIFSVFTAAFSYFTIQYSSVFALHQDRRGQLEFIAFIKRKFRLPAMLALGLFIVLLPAVKDWLHLEGYWGISMVGMTLLVSFYASFYSNSIQGWSHFKILSVIGIVVAFVKLVSGYLATEYSPGSSSAILAFLMAAVASWFLSRHFIEKKWKAENQDEKSRANDWRSRYFSGESFKKSFARILLFSAGLMVMGNLDILIVKNTVDSQISGYYGALSVLGKIIFSLNLAFIGVLFPDACSDGYGQKPAKISSVIGSYFLVMFISLPIIFIFYFFPEIVVNSLFGDKYEGIIDSLWLFGIMALFLSLITLESKLALARHDFRSTWVLLATAAFFSGGIYCHHENLRAIIYAVTLSLAIGWLGILALNLIHRLNFKKHINI